MKIRNGFVSNSSSSSFVVLLPEDFDVKKHVDANFEESVDVGDILEHYDAPEDIDEEAYAKEKTVTILNKFIKEKCVYNYDSTVPYYTIMQILEDYIIVEMEAGSGDSGEGTLLDKEDINKIKNILKIK